MMEGQGIIRPSSLPFGVLCYVNSITVDPTKLQGLHLVVSQSLNACYTELKNQAGHLGLALTVGSHELASCHYEEQAFVTGLVQGRKLSQSTLIHSDVCRICHI